MTTATLGTWYEVRTGMRKRERERKQEYHNGPTYARRDKELWKQLYDKQF